jgi:hypothetical protein
MCRPHHAPPNFPYSCENSALFGTPFHLLRGHGLECRDRERKFVNNVASPFTQHGKSRGPSRLSDSNTPSWLPRCPSFRAGQDVKTGGFRANDHAKLDQQTVSGLPMSRRLRLELEVHISNTLPRCKCSYTHIAPHQLSLNLKPQDSRSQPNIDSTPAVGTHLISPHLR